MLVFYMIHLEENPGHAQLLAGDVVQLETLLPESQVVCRFQSDRNMDQPTRLTPEEAHAFLEELRMLDLETLKDVRYPRSAVRADIVSTQKELVEDFIRFLDAELKVAAG